MPATKFTCPECQSTLKSPNAIALGTKIKCPRCEAIFPFQEDSDSADAETPRPRAKAVRPPSVPQEFAEYDDGDDDEDTIGESASDAKRPRSKNRKKKSSQNVLVLALGIGGLSLLLGGGAVAAFVWPGFLKSGPNWDEPLAFVPANNKLLLSVNVDTLIDRLGVGPHVEQALKTTVSGDLNLADMKKDTGLEFRELFSQVVIASNQLAQGQPNPNAKAVIVIKSKVPFDSKKLVAFFKVTEPPEKLNGKKYYKKTNRGETVALFFPSNRLVVITNYLDKDLELLLGADGATTVLPPDIRTMVDSYRQNEIWAVVPADASVKQTLRQGPTGFVPGGGGGQQPDASAAAFDQVKAGGFGVGLENNQVKLNWSLLCDNPAGAGQVVEAMKKQFDLYTKGLFKVMLNQIMSSWPPPVKALVDDLIKNTRFTSQANLAQASAEVSVQSVRNALAQVEQMGLAGAGGVAGAPPGGVQRPNRPPVRRPGNPGGRTPR
jgi:hypothetical protein